MGCLEVLSSVLLRAARRSPGPAQPSRAEVPRVGPRPTPERRHLAHRALAHSADLLALSAVVITLLFFDFGVRVLASNDETRFPVLARDILASGHWLSPRLGDVPYLNKPPLFAWLIAVAAGPGGAVSQSSALWPSLIAALGVSLATSWIGWRLWGRGAGLAAGFIVVTTHGVFTMARAPMPDMTMCLFLTAALAAFVGAEFDDRRVFLIGFYILLGLGFWTKGPAALLGLGVVVVFAAWTGGGPAIRRLAIPRAVLLVALLIAPWFMLTVRTASEQFWRDTVVTDWLTWHVPVAPWRGRALIEPLAQTLAILLPWSPLLAFAGVAALATEARRPGRKVVFLLVWAGVIFLFVAIGKEQRMRYYLPLCPPAALLIAAWYQRVNVPHRKVLSTATAALVAVGIVLWQLNDDARHNARTDLSALGPETVKLEAPLYAADVPDLVLTFYLGRPVIPVRTPSTLAAPGRRLERGYLAVANRLLPQWSATCPAPAIGAGTVNGLRFSVLRLEPPGCPGP